MSTIDLLVAAICAAPIIPTPDAKPLPGQLPPTLAQHASMPHLPAAERADLFRVLRTEESQERLRDELARVWESPSLGLLFDAAVRRYCTGLDPDVVSDALTAVWERGDVVFPFAFIKRRAAARTFDTRPPAVLPSDGTAELIAAEHADPRSVDELIAHLRDIGRPRLASAVRKRTMPRDARPRTAGMVFPWTLTEAERTELHRHGKAIVEWFEKPTEVHADAPVIASAIARAWPGARAD